MKDSECILEVRDLIKHFPKVKAVNGVSFRIREGICFGLLGPNGAGKTTTIEMIEGITAPSSGHILYRGEPIGPNFRERSGIQFQATSLQDYLTVREILKLFQSFYSRTADLDEVIQLCSLGEFLDRDHDKLSGGQRQRLLLAVSLVNDPDIVFLDEPTTGLDPQARRNFWDLVQKIKARRKTIVLTTHYMEEAQVLCDEIAIMDRGKLIAQGAPDQLLKQHFEGVSIEIPEVDFKEAETSIASMSGLKLSRSDGQVALHTSEVNETLKRLLGSGVSLARLRIRSRNLEDLFLDLTGKALREG